MTRSTLLSTRTQRTPRIHLLDRFRSLRDSFLMFPGLFILGGIVLAQLLIWVDRSIDTQPHSSDSILFTVGVDGARDILSTLASVLSVATMAFSIAISVMSTASRQVFIQFMLVGHAHFCAVNHYLRLKPCGQHAPGSARQCRRPP
ncbi:MULTISPECIES: DUF2254 family protein [unclassified Corynebacterium]|uniref:DUF2254 family protein n=1 Tax=unclassified Corynebacterium TaxID=2624378 RepID=UPI0034D37141